MSHSLAFQLVLRAAASPGLPQAWYLPGADTAAWLVLLSQLTSIPQALAFAVPQALASNEPGGLLVILPQANAAQPHFTHHHRLLPCRLDYGKVAVPATHVFSPTLSAAEVRQRFAFDWHCFLPGVGLCGFDSQDSIVPEQLLVPLLENSTRWLSARVGVDPLPEFQRIEFHVPMSLDDLFGSLRGDPDSIGSQRDQELPNTPKPPSKLSRDFQKLGLGFMGGILRGWSKLAGQQGGKPAGSKPPNKLLSRLQNWATDKLKRLENTREQELERLLDLLNKDPKEGLRYAIPLTGTGRGEAPPSAQLAARSNFQIGGSGKGPVSVWNIGANVQELLLQKYRQLASQELAAERYERAAFIFAELLGDWHGAAGALAKAGRHHEAAEIFLTRLRNKKRAAECYEGAGLLTDAIPLYAELREHEKCGDLWRKLHRESPAVAAYETAVKESGDRLSDARILFHKLQRPELAVQVLETGWPNSNQARACLTAQFRYLQLMNAPTAALDVMRRLADPQHQLPEPTAMLEVFLELHNQHAEKEIRQQATTHATKLIARQLGRSPNQDIAAQWLNQLPAFAADDTLLLRDTHRFRETRARQHKPPGQGEVPNQNQFTENVLDLSTLNTAAVWQTLTSNHKRWLASGVTHQGERIFVLGSVGLNKKPKLHLQTLPNTKDLPTGHPEFLSDNRMLLPRNRGYIKAPLCCSNFEFENKHLPNLSDQGSTRLPWMPEAIAWAIGGTNLAFLTGQFFERMALNIYDIATGNLSSTSALPSAAKPEDVTAQPHLLCAKGDLVLGWHTQLTHLWGGKLQQQLTFDAPIHHLEMRPPLSKSQSDPYPLRVLVCAGDSVWFVDLKNKDHKQLLYQAPEGQANAAILRDGRIACVGSSGGLMLDQRLRKLGNITLRHDNPAPIVAAATNSSFGLLVLRSDGKLEMVR